MNVLDTPFVPTLSDFRLSTRQEHLVQEIAGRRRNRRRGGLALGGGALVREWRHDGRARPGRSGHHEHVCGLDGSADDARARPGIERRGDLRSRSGDTST